MTTFVGYIIEKISPKFNAHRLKFYLDSSFICIEKILVKLDKLLNLYLGFYEDMIKNEIALANISKDSKILHIGSGSIPATPILMTRKTNAKITSIDINQNSVKQAQNLISKIGLSDKIEIKTSDVLHFPITNFDIIIISQGVSPYNKAIEYMAKNIGKDSKVIFRTTSDEKGNLVEQDLFLKKFFTIEKTVAHKKNGLLISILLIKNN